MAPDVIELGDAGWARHDFYMRLALVVESGAKCLGSRVGAVIVRDDRVLGSLENRHWHALSGLARVGHAVPGMG